MKRIISILLSTFIVISLFMGVSANVSAAYAATDDSKAYPQAPLFLEDVDSIYYGFELVAESENLGLYVIETNPNIAVLNKKTGMIWSSLIMEEGLDGRFYSLFSVMDIAASSQSVTTLSERYSHQLLDININSYDGEIIAPNEYIKIDYASVKNGIRISAYYESEVYRMDIDIYLDTENEALVVEFDGEEALYQSPSRKWVTLNVLPFFGAASDTEDGYVFYPDGSGTIADFTPNHTSGEASKILPFYSQELAAVDLLASNEADGTMPVMYPVFGMKRGNEAFVGIITDTACMSAVRYSPAGALINYNRVHPIFFLMALRDRRSDISTQSYSMEGDIAKELYRVEYHFLDGDDADYSGMAVEYRNYLLRNDLLNDAIADNATMPLALDLFMNTYESTIFGNKTIVMTTFSQAEDMVRELYDRGIKDMLLNISSWQKNGLSMVDVVPAASAIGGTSGLKALAETVKELGYDIFMQVNMEFASSSTTKFKSSRDAAKDLEGLSIIGTYFLIVPPIVQERYEDIYRPYFEDIGISGLNFETLGYFLYYYRYASEDYNRLDAETLFTSTMAEAKSDFGKNAVWYGNQYSLKYADWIYDLPSTNTGYANTTREVPFAQIVLHGYIPYSSIAGNMFYDDVGQTLKWIEYGYIPYYKLTNNSSDLLLNTDMAILFSAQFEDWVDSIVEKYNFMLDTFGYLYSIPIVDHTMLSDEVFVTTYEDGTKVYVNYGTRDYTTPDGVVSAESYLLVKG